jgi:hypothetical protein
VRGGAASPLCPALPDDVWRVIVGVHCDGKRARRAACVSRLFAVMAREHEDNVVPVSAAGAVDGSEFSEPEESDDYMCCECGGWTRANEVIDETVIDPWGGGVRPHTEHGGARAAVAGS